MQKEKNAISPLGAVLTVVATFFLSLFLVSAFYAFLGTSIALVLGELTLIVLPLFYMIYKKVDVKTYIGLNATPKMILLGIAFGAFLLFFNLIISATAVSIFGKSEAVTESNQLLLDMSSSLGGLLSLIISLSLAGICEEFVFRGFLQTAVNSKYSFAVALFASSLAFGIFHFDPQGVYVILGFLMGAVLGYIYHHWHSYTVSAVAHATMNLIVLAMTVLLV